MDSKDLFLSSELGGKYSTLFFLCKLVDGLFNKSCYSLFLFLSNDENVARKHQILWWWVVVSSSIAFPRHKVRRNVGLVE